MSIRSSAPRLTAVAIFLAAAGPAAADPVAPYETAFQGITLTAGGAADATALTALPGERASGAATAWLDLTRDYDTGLRLSLNGSFRIYADRLSFDGYGDDFVQKVYGRAQTGLGTFDIGMEDGAAKQLSVAGPVADIATSLNDATITFFRNPLSGRATIDVFALDASVSITDNYAKFSYYTPKLFGVQIGVSYTPSQGKYVLPFVDSGPFAENRQDGIWETAIRYDGYRGPFEIAISAGGAVAHADAGSHTKGHKGLTDWAAGGRIAYPLDGDTKIAIGGAYRRSDAYAFGLGEVRTGGATTSAHLSARLTRKSWSAGFEYGRGTADGGTLTEYRLTKLHQHGYGAAVGYALNDNWSATLGWQRLHYRRDAGTFYNGKSDLGLDAVYLHLRFQIAPGY